VLCNTHIKWDALLKRADKLGCDFIATGHYARLRFENDRYIISKGIDPLKDQSYALMGCLAGEPEQNYFSARRPY
jgi:tRNA-specific 2-thiouridylase